MLCLLLSGCWSPQARLDDCMFGGATKAQAEECAVRNFGVKGARLLRERQALCTDAADPVWAAINCPDFPKAEEPRPRANRTHLQHQEG